MQSLVERNGAKADYLTETGFEDPLYAAINGSEDARTALFNQATRLYGAGGTNPLGMLFGGSAKNRSELLQMTQDEIDMFNYIYATNGRDAAHDYYDRISGDLNYRQRLQEEARWTQYAEERPGAASALSVLGSPLKALSYAGQMVDYMDDRQIDENAAYNKFSYNPTAIRAQVSDTIEKSGKWGKVGSFAYNTGMSMGDFLFNTVVGGGNEPVVLALMGMEAAADTVLDKKAKGYSDDRAFILGTVAGAIEAVTEKIGFDALFKTGIVGLGREGLRQYVLRNMASEGAEEGLADIFNWASDALYDVFSGENDSEWKRRVRELAAAGDDKAALHTLAEHIDELTLDMAGGMLSGGVMAGVGGAGMAINYSRTGGAINNTLGTDAVQALVNEGLQNDPETQSYQYANEIQARMARGEQIGSLEVGQLFHALQADSPEVRAALEAQEQTRVNEEMRRVDSMLPAQDTPITQYDLGQQAEGTYGGQGYTDEDRLWQLAQETARQETQPETPQQMQGRFALLRAAAEDIARQQAAQQQPERQTQQQQNVRSKEPGLVRDEVAKKANLTNREARALDALGRVIGKKIRFAESLTAEIRDENGNVQRSGANAQIEGDTITISLQSEDPFLVAAVHEVVHGIRDVDEEAYQALANFVTNNMSDRASFYATREQAEMGYSREQIPEETVATAFGRMLGDEKTLRQFVSEHTTAAERFMDALRDLLDKIRQILTGSKRETNTLTENQRAVYKDLEGRLDKMLLYFTDALNAVKESESEEGSGEVKYNRAGRARGPAFEKHKYYSNIVKNIEEQNPTGYTLVGEIADNSAYTDIGMPAGRVYFDNSKILDELNDPDDPLPKEYMQRVPEILADPTVIVESNKKNTISVFGEVRKNGVPVLVGVMVAKDRSGRNVINKIRTVHTRGHAASMINDDTVLYMNEDRKRTRDWFQASRIDMPLGGTKFGPIRTITLDLEKSNTPKRNSLMSPTVYNRTVVLNESTVDKYLEDYASKSTPNYAQAYITYMSPKQFLDLTTSSRGRAVIESETTDLDVDNLAKASVDNPFQLNIDHETGEVTGHEGRHRANALLREGINKIPVLLFDSSNKYSKAAMDSLTLTGQDFGRSRSYATVTVNDVQPLSYANRDNVVKTYATQPTNERIAENNGRKTVRYSLTSEKRAEAAKPADLNPNFARVRYSLAPPYRPNTAGYDAFVETLSKDARSTYDMFSSVHDYGMQNRVTIDGSAKDITQIYMTTSKWNAQCDSNAEFAKTAKALAEMLPADVRKAARIGEDGRISETPFEKEFKMERAFIQRLIDSLPNEVAPSTYKTGGKTVRVAKGDKIESVGGEGYRRALVEERRALYRAGKLPTKSIGGMSKDTWGAMGFLATNGKTGASGDFTTLCPQMYFNKGCFYCYRRAALTTGVNNKLMGENVWYTGEILHLTKEDIDRLNRNGGLRIQSFGDWMSKYSTQLADLLIDAETVGLQIKIITKEPSMIDTVALLKEQGLGKNLYFNLSADYTIEKQGTINNQDTEGALPRNPLRPYQKIGNDTYWKRALTVEEANQFRQKYPWVNTRIVATTVAEFLEGLRSPIVDVVTGYHGNIRQFERVSSATGETLLEVEPLGDAGMPRFAFDSKNGKWVLEYEGKTATHKTLARAIEDAGLQFQYYIKSCCITGRCATCEGKCGKLAKDFNVKNATNADKQSVAYWQKHMTSAEDNPLLLDQMEDEQAKALLESEVRYSRAGRDVLDELIEQYGPIDAGENPVRDVPVPKRTTDKTKVSMTVRTVAEAGATPEEFVPTIENLVANHEFDYTPYSDKKAIANANSYVSRKGYQSALAEWEKTVGRGEVSKTNTAVGWALYNNAVNSGDTENALQILRDIVAHQRNAAQAVQATRILKQLNPETQLYNAEKTVEQLNDDLRKKYGDKAPELEIDRDLAERFLHARSDEGRAKAMSDIYKDIGRQMPTRFLDRWNAWRYLAMLGNPRTHIRNVVGNAGFAPIVATKDLVATGIEAAVDFVSGGKLNRTKGVAGADLMKAAWDDYANIREQALGEGKYSDAQLAQKEINDARRIFGNTRSKLWNKSGGAVLERARKLNGDLLDKEDVWFSKPHYTLALAQYCAANHISAAQICSGKGIETARQYAIREAQKATYRDTNAFSEAVSRLGRGAQWQNNKASKLVSMAMEGILPFRKTPANILVRGVEYSPIGLVKSITYDLAQVKKGNMSGADMIDHLAAGLTGTGLLALGAYLAAQGILRGRGGDDDKKKKFDDLTGHQDYAIEFRDGTSITLDWLAPEALPLFMGANLVETARERNGNMKLADILSAIGNVTEPMLEMSCLQSLNAVFDTVGYAKEGDVNALTKALASAATSYLTQALPTIGGQAERTGEDKRMTTYTDKNKWLTGDMQYTLGKASAKIPIPGVDYQQIPYIDAWGREETTGGFAARLVNNFFNPAFLSKVNESDMEKELERLYKQTGETVFPERPPKYFTVDGERKDLNADEYVTYATNKGRTAYTVVGGMVNSELYKSLPDNEKAAVVKDALSYANQTARTTVGGTVSDSWVNNARTGVSYGIAPETYILVRNLCGNVQSIKDSNGKTISNSSGLLKMEAIYKIPGLNDKQRKYLFECNGVGSSIIDLNKAAVQEKLAKMR